MAAKSEASRIIDAVIAAGPAPLLKEAGYQKASRSFFASQGEVYKVVQFQASMGNTPEQGRFIVNLMIVVPFVHETWTGGEPFPKNPATAQWTVFYRHPELLQKKRNWWKVTPKTNVAKIAAEITSAISEHGLPFLDAHTDLDLVIQEVENKKAKFMLGTNGELFLAILHAHQGNREEAARLIQMLAKKYGSTGLGATVTKIGQRVRLSTIAAHSSFRSGALPDG